MANDPIGYMGLDTKQFKAAVRDAVAELQKLNRAQEVTDANQKKMGASMNSLRNVAGALGIPVAIGQVVSALRSLGTTAIETGDRINEARDRFVAGSSRLEMRTGNVDPTQSQALGSFVDDLIARKQNEVGAIAAKSMTGAAGLVAVAKDFVSKASGKGSAGAVDALTTEIAKRETAFKKANIERERARDIENQIADIESNGVITADQKLSVLKLQKEAAEANLAAAEALEDRQGINKAKALMGQRMAQIDAEKNALRNEMRDASAMTDQIALQQAGMKGVADQVAIIAEYETRITNARREGKTDLADQLELQQKMKLNAAAVAEHNKTPAELREERRDARKFQRDIEKTDAQNRDMKTRLDRMREEGFKPTPGSRLARFAEAEEARKRAQAADPKEMKVNNFETQTMRVKTAIIGNL